MSQITSMQVPTYAGKLSPFEGIDGLESEWRALEADSNCSFFLTWSWIGTWLQLVNGRTKLFIYRCYQNDRLVALAIISADSVRRRLFFHSTTLALNESRRSHLNMFIEYNGLLSQKGHETATLNQLVADLIMNRPEWDEIQLSNIPMELYNSLRHLESKLNIIVDAELGVWIAPLDTSTTINSILSKLKKNRRWQLRRSLKEYEREGALRIDSANNLDETRSYFLQMGELHTRRWNRVGKGGSFARPEWVKFHLALLANTYERGEIQMLRIRCGERVIGYIYNFIWRDSVLILQSGFASESSNLLRPGYISHLLAMQYNAAKGATQYNFLAGESEYKRVLGIAHPPLASGRIQRPQIKFLIEETLVSLYRFAKRIYTTSGIATVKNHSKLVFWGYLTSKMDFYLFLRDATGVI